MDKILLYKGQVRPMTKNEVVKIIFEETERFRDTPEANAELILDFIGSMVQMSKEFKE